MKLLVFSPELCVSVGIMSVGYGLDHKCAGFVFRSSFCLEITQTESCQKRNYMQVGVRCNEQLVMSHKLGLVWSVCTPLTAVREAREGSIIPHTSHHITSHHHHIYKYQFCSETEGNHAAYRCPRSLSHPKLSVSTVSESEQVAQQRC